MIDILHAGSLAILFAGFCLGAGSLVGKCLDLPPSMNAAVGFGVMSLAGLIAFCAWWISPVFGGGVSLALGLGGVAIAAAQIADPGSRRVIRASLPAMVATLLLAAAWLCLLHAAGVPAASRFMGALPEDNELPRMLAERLAAGNLTGPLAGDWLMSDRPPLLAGVLLLFRPFGADGGLAAAVIATLCQMMWLPALVALGQSLALGWRRISVGIVFAATSGFFLLNTLYTWPKLMAAALFITAVAVVMGALRDGSVKPVRIAATAGALLSLAVLSHGGVWFSLLALPALPLAWRALRWFGARGVVVLVLAFLAIGAPWSAFKRFVDPPGNRLEKWHLAGVVPVDERSTVEAIRDAYAKTPPAEIQRARLVNVQFVAGVFGRNSGERWGDYIRRLQFFHFLPAVGLPLLGVGWIVFSWLRHGSRDGTAGLVAHVAATVVVWLVLSFQQGSTIVHAGSYVPVALLIFLGGAAVARWRFAVLVPLAIMHVALFLTGWIVTTPAAGGASIDLLLMSAAATLVLGALAAFPALSREASVGFHGRDSR